jgi:hypothetical protein
MMRNKILLWGVFLLIPFFSLAQMPSANKTNPVKKRAYAAFGTGVYWDTGLKGYVDNFKDNITGLTPKPVVRGQDIWIEGGIRLNDGLIFSAKMMYVPLKRKYLDFIYKGQEYNYNIKYITVNLGYEFSLGRGHKLKPQLGFVYYRETTTKAAYHITRDNNGQIATFTPYIDKKVDEEAGAVLDLDYYYQFKSNLILGLRTSAIYVLGMEGVSVTPIIGFKF